MKYLTKYGLSAAALALLAGCASTGFNSNPGIGALYHESSENVAVTSKSLHKGSGVGVACSTNILGLVTFGDASVHEAMRSASITDVVIVDKTYNNLAGVYGRSCTVVRGN